MDLIPYRDRRTNKAVTVSDIIRMKAAGNWESYQRSGVLVPFKPLGQTAPPKVPQPGGDNRNIQAHVLRGGALKSALVDAGIKTIAVDSLITTPALQRIDTVRNMQVVVTSMNTSSGKSLINFVQATLAQEKLDRPTNILADGVPENILLRSDTSDAVAKTLFPQGYPIFDGKGNSPHFSQHMRNYPADADTYLTLELALQNTLKLGLSQESQVLDAAMNKFARYARNFYYGTGEQLGQVGRIKVGYEVAKFAREHRANIQGNVMHQYMNDYALYKVIRDTVCPLYPFKKLSESASHPLRLLLTDPDVTGVDYWGTEFTARMYNPNGQSAAGFPWTQGTLKAETIDADICLCSDVVDAYNLAFESATTLRFEKNFGWLRLYQCKAKEEATEIEKFKTKVRNIFPPPTALTIPAIVTFNLAKRNYGTYFRNQECVSIMGFSPAHGGMDQLITRVHNQLERGAKNVVLTYADNMFIFCGKVMASLDIRSMESAHAPKMFQFAVRYMLESVFNCKYDLSGFLIHSGEMDAKMAAFMQHYYATHVSAAIGVLQNMQIEIPGLPSGAPGTFEFNDAFMSLVAGVLKKDYMDTTWLNEQSEPIEIVKKVINDAGMDFKLVHRLTHENSFEIAKSNPFSYNKMGHVIPADILGYDVAYFKVSSGTYAIGVLQEDRLWKSFIFNKTLAKHPNLKADSATNIVVRLGTISTLYIFGGWAFPELAAAMKAAAVEFAAKLKSLTGSERVATTAEIANVLADIFSELGDEALLDYKGAVGILQSIEHTGVPTLWHVIKIMLPQEALESYEFDVMTDEALHDDLDALLPGEVIMQYVQDGADVPDAVLARVEETVESIYHLLDRAVKTPSRPRQLKVKNKPSSAVLPGPSPLPAKLQKGPPALPKKKNTTGVKGWNSRKPEERRKMVNKIKERLTEMEKSNSVLTLNAGVINKAIRDKDIVLSLFANHLNVNRLAFTPEDMQRVKKLMSIRKVVISRS